MKRFWSVCLIAGILLPMALEAKLVVSHDVVISHSVTSIGMCEDGLVLFGESGIDYDHGGLLIWTWSDGEKTDLGRGRLYDISADGSTVVGEIRHPAPTNYPNLHYGEAAFWKDGILTPIGYLPGAEFLSSEALLVSENGSVIIGRSATEAGYEMFRYEGGMLTGLGVDGWPQAISYDGSRFIFADYGLWLWNNGSMEQFVFPDGYAFGGFDMSSDGTIVVGSGSAGSAIRWGNGQPIALATPEDAPDFASCAAFLVSGDGSVILGTLFHPIGITFGYVLWREADNWNPVSLQDLLPPDLGISGINYDGSTLIGRQFDGSTYQAVRIQILDMFGQYRITEGVAETGAWLGRVQAMHDPWVWCEDAPAGWLYFPSETANAEQGWVYSPDPDSLQITQVDGTGWWYSFALDKWMYLTASGWAYMM